MKDANRRHGRSNHATAFLAVLLLWSGLAVAQDRPAATGASHSVADQQRQLRANRGNPNAEKENARLDTADRTMMREMALAHYGEIQQAALVQEISTDAKVRAFAQTLMDDHYAALGELRKLADAKGVILPGGADTDDAAAAAKLAHLNGKEFDRQFIASTGAGARDKAVKLFQDAQNRAKDEDLKAYAAQVLPVLTRHLQAAQRL